MSSYPKLTIRVSDSITPTKLQQKLLNLIDNDDVRRGVNQIIGDRANKYVPMKSGALRASMKVGPKTITWGSGLDYARYQYGGEIYGINRPLVSQHVIHGWYSIPGVKKVPTGRMMGEILGLPGIWESWPFGYTTPGTKYDWINEMLKKEKRSMNVQITRYLKQEAAKRNL